MLHDLARRWRLFRYGGNWRYMPRQRKIPDVLAPELIRLAEVEQLTYEAIAAWLADEHEIEASDNTVRRAIWRYKGIQDAARPEDEAPAPESGDPEDALHSLRYQLARDAQVVRVRMIRDSSDGDAGKLYLGLQSLRVRLLCALRDKGRQTRGEAQKVPDQQPVQPVARFVVNGRPVQPS